MNTTKPHIERLQKLGACHEAVRWAESYNSMAEVWAACERGDWMLWLAGKLSGPPESEGRKRLVLAACDCAELALPKFTEKYPDDDRPANAIKTARAWANGEATIAEVRKADAAADAAYAAYAAYAADAAYAAADAAYAAAAAAYAAADAAATAADAADARNITLKQCADIVRKHYPTPPEF